MRRLAYALAVALFGASSASAQQDSNINCAAPNTCQVFKYGLSAPDSYGKEPDPIFENVNPTITPQAHDFAGSYGFQKDVTGPGSPKCDGEGGFVGVYGQVLLREQVSCTPTPTVGCPVEVAIDLNPPATQVGSPTETWFADSRLIFVNAQLAPGFFVQMFISTASHGRIHGYGQRFANAAGGGSRIRWSRFGTGSQLQAQGDYTRGDARSKVCCNYVGGFNLCEASGLSVYPVITDTQALASVINQVPDWIFTGGRGTPFATDRSYVVPGQKYGVCKGDGFPDQVRRAHRRVGCDLDACASRGMVCQDSDPGAPVVNTCNGIAGGIACVPDTNDECNLSNPQCNEATGFCNSEPPGGTSTPNTDPSRHIGNEVPCTTDADCDLNDVCDLSEGGYRLNRVSTIEITNGDGSCLNDLSIRCTTNADCAAVGGNCGIARIPNPELCGEALFFWRGTPDAECSIVTAFLDFDQCEQQASLTPANDEPGCIVPSGVFGRRRGICGLRPAGTTGAFTPVVPNIACEIDGDPGSDCMGRNYGPAIRPDRNCDGVIDLTTDLCPMYNETDPFSDENGDGRGDECQCGDATPPSVSIAGGVYSRDRDGFVTVADLVSTNILIFNDPAAGTGADGRYRLSAPTCDSTGDSLCNVSDIVGTNLEVFSPGYTSRCFRFPCPEPLTSCTSTGAPLP
jgi:hypothetical protein